MTVHLTAMGLTLIRGESCLFQDLDLALSSGELLLLEGPNGSGKTSLLRVIAGLLSVESGEVRWCGNAVADQRQVFHNEVVWLGHRTGLKADLTLLENLRFEASLRPQSGADLKLVCERLGILHLSGLPLRALSAGQQRRVALARLLLSAAPLWLMDEPFTNLDRDGRDLVVSLIEEHLDAGGMCVLAAHSDVVVAATTKRVTL